MDATKLIQVYVARSDIAIVSAWHIIKAVLPVLVGLTAICFFLMRRWR